jgi:DNA-binding transcriptional MerR regulator
MGMRREHEPGLRSGALAHRTGVSTDTLRHYERLGLLPAPPRTGKGYRLYPADSVHRVRLIQCALDVGLTLEDIGRVLTVRDRGGTPCRTVRALAARQLQEVEERIEQLGRFRRDLRRLLRDWDHRLAQTTAGRRAELLDALITTNARPRHPQRRR